MIVPVPVVERLPLVVMSPLAEIDPPPPSVMAKAGLTVLPVRASADCPVPAEIVTAVALLPPMKDAAFWLFAVTLKVSVPAKPVKDAV